jgi:tetratricopeptide (TPR) repeat protein
MSFRTRRVERREAEMLEVAPQVRTWLPLTLLALASIGAGLGLGWWWLRGPSRPLEEGRLAYSRGEWARAEAVARRRLKSDPGDLDAVRLLARSAARLGHDEVANRLFARLGASALEAEDLFLLGLGLARNGHKDRAWQVWLKALTLSPRHAETLEQLVISSTAQNRLAEAAGYAERLSHQPGWELRGELDWGALLAELNDPARAAAVLEQALKRPQASSLDRSALARYRKLLARKLLETGRPGEATIPLTAVESSGPDPEASWLLSRGALQQGKLGEALAALKAAGTYRRDHPLEADPGLFVGESRCAACHSHIVRQSQSSRHTRTLIRGDALLELPYPDHPIPDPDNPSVTHSLERENRHVRFETRGKDRVRRAIVAYAFGSLDRYVSLVGPDEAGHAYILRLSHFHNPKEAGWVRTTGHTADASGGHEFLGKALEGDDAVQRCLFCHSTNPKAVIDHSGPESNDRAIGCERCHGPGGNHLLAVAARFPDLAIANATEATAEGRIRVCGQCHSYHQELLLPKTDPFWIRFQGTALTWSRCYTESGGNFDCMTCHDPHHDSDRSLAHYDARCLSCHAGGGAESTPTAAKSAPRSTGRLTGAEPAQTRRGSICPVNASGGCVGCHMPAFQSKPIHATFTDHYIRVHPD